MTKEEKVKIITNKLKEEYPTVETPLHHKNTFELLIATMLSAQTLDATVNKVTPTLFEKYSTPKALSKANVKDIEKIIYLVNFNKTKSRNIIKTSQMLIDNFNSNVPGTIEELITFPGVGRKTANVVIGQAFKNPEGFVVDTHVGRVSRRLGLTKNTDAVKVEYDLMKLFPQPEWDDMSLRLIFHGRYRCKSRNPECYKDPFWSKICSCVKEKRVN